MQPRKNVNAPLLPAGHGKSDLRITLAKNRAARAQQEQEQAENNVSANRTVEAPAADAIAADTTTTNNGTKKKKKKPLPSFLPDYESPGGASTTTATTTARMSRDMLEDLSLASSAKPEQATEKGNAEGGEPSAPSPYGAALLQRKVYNQQRRNPPVCVGGSGFVAASLPTLSFDDVADTAGQPTEVLEVDVILAGEVEPSEVEPSATEEADTKAAAAEDCAPAMEHEREPAMTEPLRFEATATKTHSWLGGQCVAAASTSLASATSAASASSQPSLHSSTPSRRMGLASALLLTAAAVGLVLTAAAGARASSRSTSARA